MRPELASLSLDEGPLSIRAARLGRESEVLMTRILGSLSDRLLGLVCPRVAVSAGPICDIVAHCVHCGYQGSMQKHRWHRLWSNCREYWGPCLVNNAGCTVK